MRRPPKSLVPLVTVAAMAVLLLEGCHHGKHEKHKAPAVEQTEAVVDTTKEDTMAAYYERMQRLKILLEVTNHWESEK